jgi:hypothetical protein
MMYMACFLMFKHWFCWKYPYNKYTFNFIDIYIFIPASACVGMGPSALLCLEAYNAAKMALYHYIYLLLIKQLKYLLWLTEFLLLIQISLYWKTRKIINRFHVIFHWLVSYERLIYLIKNLWLKKSATIETKNVLVVVVSILQKFCKSQEIFKLFY